MRPLLCVCISLILGCPPCLSVEGTAKPLPVYVYLFAHYEDHINLELSEWRIKEVMGILSEAQKAHRGRCSAAVHRRQPLKGRGQTPRLSSSGLW